MGVDREILGLLVLTFREIQGDKFPLQAELSKEGHHSVGACACGMVKLQQYSFAPIESGWPYASVRTHAGRVALTLYVAPGID